MFRNPTKSPGAIALFLFTACFCGGTLLYSQSSIFSRQFKSAGTEAYVITHLATSDGGTLVLTDQRKVATGQHYMDLIKTDDQGTLQWSKRFGPLQFGMKNVVQSPDSTYFLCFSQNPFGHFYEMIKLDANGNILFDKRVDFPVVSRVGIFPMCIARNDGGYYVACTITDTTTYVTTWNVFSLDANGNLLWSNGYNADTFTLEVTTMDTCSNGDIILAGTFFDLTQQKYEMIITRINSAGTMLWTKDCVSVGIYDYYPREIAHIGNDILLVAVAYNSVSVESSTVLIKMDNAGNVLWSSRYEHFSSQIDPFDLVTVENNNLAITGTANTPNIASFFLKVDSSGQVLSGRIYYNWNIHTLQENNAWQYSISGTFNDSLYPQTAFMVTDITGQGCADGPLTITQNPITFSTTNGSGFQPYPFTIVQGSTPVIASSFYEVDICRFTGIQHSTNPPEASLAAFPCPASNSLKVESGDNITCIDVLDVNGRIVLTEYPDTKTCEINVTSLSASVYFLRVQTSTGLYSQRIIVSH